MAKWNTAQPVNTWTHLTAVYNMSNDTVKLFVNGVSRATQSTATPFSGSGPLVLGAAMSNGVLGHNWVGQISDVQVYQKALTGAEVTAVYNGTAPTAGSSVTRTSFTYDQRGLPTSSIDPNGVKSYVSYDEAGRAVVFTSPSVWSEDKGAAVPQQPVFAPAVSMVGYDTFGAVTETRDPKGRVITTAYNANGQAVSQTLPTYTPPDGGAAITNATSSVTYDALGRTSLTTDPLGRQTENHYDILNRLDWVRAPDNGVTHYEYSLGGQTTAVVDPSGARSQATFDYLGNQVTATQIVRQPTVQAAETDFEYWPSGQLKKVTPPGRNPIQYQYNAVGQPTTVTDQAGNVTAYTYDFVGRPADRPARRQRRPRPRYDGAGRPVKSETLAQNGTTVLATSLVAYDRAGNVVSATDPARPHHPDRPRRGRPGRPGHRAGVGHQFHHHARTATTSPARRPGSPTGAGMSS